MDVVYHRIINSCDECPDQPTCVVYMRERGESWGGEVKYGRTVAFIPPDCPLRERVKAEVK